MAGGVDEVLAVAGLLDDGAGGGVDVDEPGARGGGLDAGELGAENDVVDLAGEVVGLAHDDGAGHVRVEGAGVGAEVHDDEVAAAQDAVAGGVVRLGGVGAGGDDGVEGGALGAEAAHAVLEVGGDVPLGAADGQLTGGDEILEGLGGELGDLDEAQALGVVLGETDLLDDPGDGDEGDVLVAGLLQLLQVGDGDVGGLVADAARTLDALEEGLRGGRSMTASMSGTSPAICVV